MIEWLAGLVCGSFRRVGRPSEAGLPPKRPATIISKTARAMAQRMAPMIRIKRSVMSIALHPANQRIRLKYISFLL
jgi:hypothetical protein